MKEFLMASVLASFPVVVIKYPHKSYLREKIHIWLTIPGYGQLPRKSKEEEHETVGHSTPMSGAGGQCVHACLLMLG